MVSKKKLQFKAKLLYNKREKGSFFRLKILAPAIAASCLPGQFVTLRLTDGCQPLLRRPFSIHRISGSGVEILYELVGRGTQILSQKRPGEYLDIIGPLGNGFNYPLSAIRYPLSILVAGGMGVAPLLFLAERLAYSVERRAHSKGRLYAKRYPLNAFVLIGAKNKNQILCEKEFRKFGCTVKIATDDGSKGYKGKVTQLLQHLLSTIDHRLSTIYGCGPRPMLKEISRICQRRNLAAQLSLEEHMACGIGACLGCAVDTKEGYKTVCKDGPVFDADRIIWEAE
ncbi:MAG: dihydroorotate dehydrogenase electron transfer subunit [Candidatus Omnitrophica bacterium]|nr:dihydroorotate dehydrogenase electron transfer subunit [Candidatus Omnitrophota bacterium]MBL7210723.1 dihydroorotate dehydrogenase electron transfer subunit [Candidatus Omnitrophota bacterium]